MNEQLIKYLEEFVNPARVELLNKNLNNRTQYITIVLEDIFQPHNSSAILRSCDCFGIQDIHIIENRNKYLPNSEIALGAEQWLTLTKYNNSSNNSAEALTSLKNKGYRIIATTPHDNCHLLTDFDLSEGKCAFVFGTELTGVSQTVENMADGFIKIPMYGFTESFNISVSVAILLYQLTQKLHTSDLNWHIEGSEKLNIKLKWLRNSIKKPHLIEKYFLEKILKEH